MNPRLITSANPLTRRTFLRGTGVVLALPWLEAMSFPKRAYGAPVAGAADDPPRRFVGVMTNLGILPQFFFPSEAGRDYAATPYLQILNEHRNDFTVFSGVSLPGVDGGHAAERSFLTGVPHPGSGSFRNGISLDQLVSEKMGAATRFPSLTTSVGSASTGLAWTRSGSMIPPKDNPLGLYQQLFVEDTPEAKAASVQRLAADRSLLDVVREKARRLERQVGAADRERLDQFYTAIRDLEKRLAASESWIDKPKPKVTTVAPEELKDPTLLIKNTTAIFDIIKLAFQTDSTRAATIFINTDLTAKEIPGVSTQVHGLSHHGGRPAALSELKLVEEAQFRALAQFLSGLRDISEAPGSLLDRTAVLYGTNMGSANAHSNENLPVLLAGGGFKHAGHLGFDREKNYPLTNLYVSVLQRLGIEVDTFSTGTGTMRGLELV